MHPFDSSRSAGDGTMTVNVLSMLPEGEPQGSFDISIALTATGHTLLRHVCKKACVPVSPTYVLHMGEGKLLPMDQPLVDFCEKQERITVYWDTSDNLQMPRGSCWNFYWGMVVLSLLFGCAGLIAIFYIHFQPLDSTQYGIVFDAGSSGTAMFVYKWEGRRVDGTPVVTAAGTRCDTDDAGITSYANNTGNAGESLTKCLDNAKWIIPASKQSSSYIYVVATAGMRLLQKENHVASGAILDSIRYTLFSYPFDLADSKSQVRILTGQEQAAVSWITSSDIHGLFQKHPASDSPGPEKPVGILELGSVSTEISFVPSSTESIPQDDLFSLTVYGTNYTLYTHSYLCYGLTEAARRLQAALVKAANFSRNIQNPCLPQGYSFSVTHGDIFSSGCVRSQPCSLPFGDTTMPSQNRTYHFSGQSNAAACRALVSSTLFNLSVPCLQPSCPVTGFFRPPLTGDFYASSLYFEVMEFLNLTRTEHISYSDFQRAIPSLCANTWQQVQTMKTKSQHSLPWYCFQSVFVDILLVDAYGFEPNSSWNKLHFAKFTGGADTSWTSGFMMYVSTQPPQLPGKPISTVTFSLLIVLFIAFTILSFFFVPWAMREQRASRQAYSSKEDNNSLL